MKMTSQEPFRFRQFSINHDKCSMKVGTDGVLLGSWAPIDNVHRALDVGTGSGIIAIMLAQRMSKGIIDGIEIDEKSAGQAGENMAASPWSKVLNCKHISLQDFARGETQTYDLIVSNPPFFTGGTLSGNQDRYAVRHAVKLPHGDLLQGVRSLLAPEGRFALILPFLEGIRFREMAASYRLYCRATTSVRPRSGKPVARLLMCFEQSPGQEIKQELLLHKGNSESRTEDFHALTKAFYPP